MKLSHRAKDQSHELAKSILKQDMFRDLLIDNLRYKFYSVWDNELDEFNALSLGEQAERGGFDFFKNRQTRLDDYDQKMTKVRDELYVDGKSKITLQNIRDCIQNNYPIKAMEDKALQDIRKKVITIFDGYEGIEKLIDDTLYELNHPKSKKNSNQSQLSYTTPEMQHAFEELNKSNLIIIKSMIEDEQKRYEKEQENKIKIHQTMADLDRGSSFDDLSDFYKKLQMSRYKLKKLGSLINKFIAINFNDQPLLHTKNQQTIIKQLDKARSLLFATSSYLRRVESAWDTFDNKQKAFINKARGLFINNFKKYFELSEKYYSKGKIKAITDYSDSNTLLNGGTFSNSLKFNLQNEEEVINGWLLLMNEFHFNNEHFPVDEVVTAIDYIEANYIYVDWLNYHELLYKHYLLFPRTQTEINESNQMIDTFKFLRDKVGMLSNKIYMIFGSKSEEARESIGNRKIIIKQSTLDATIKSLQNLLQMAMSGYFNEITYSDLSDFNKTLNFNIKKYNLYLIKAQKSESEVHKYQNIINLLKEIQEHIQLKINKM